MALVLKSLYRRPIYPRGDISLLASQRRTPADTSGTRLWLPSDLATIPKAWLDADALSGADASTVSTFTDRMTAFDATLAAGTGPVLRYSSQNGLKTVEFTKTSAAQMTMSSSLMNGATEGAYFAVFKLKNDPTNDSANGGDVAAVLDAFTSDLSVPASHHPFTDGNFYDHFGVTSRQTLGDPTPSFSTSHRIFNCEITSGGTYTNRIDATQFFQATGQTVGFGVKTRNLAWTNAGGAALYYLNGYVAEVLVLDAVPSPSDQAKLEGYLAWKWGLQANLPVGHTYKSAAPTIANSGVTGNLNQSLSILTLSSNATLNISGSLNKTLDLLISSATSQLLIKGSLNKTLGGLTGTETGQLLIKGSVNKTLGSLTLSSTAAASLNGSLNKTLGLLTLTHGVSATNGQLLIKGSLGKTLGVLTLSSQGYISLSGSLNQTLGVLTGSEVGQLLIKGSLTGTLGSLTSVSLGRLLIRGSVNTALSSLSLTSVGHFASHGGSLNQTLSSLLLYSLGKVEPRFKVIRKKLRVTSFKIRQS